jgi:hypothetical protein
MFELEPGTVKNANKGLDKYEVKIENGDVFVKVTKKKDFNW